MECSEEAKAPKPKNPDFFFSSPFTGGLVDRLRHNFLNLLVQ